MIFWSPGHDGTKPSSEPMMINHRWPGEVTHSMMVTVYAPPFQAPFFMSMENLFWPLYLSKDEENVVSRPLIVGKIW